MTGIGQLTLLLRAQPQRALRQDDRAVLVKQIPERILIVGELAHHGRDRRLVDDEDHCAERIRPVVVNGKDNVQIRFARSTLHVRAALLKGTIARQIVFIQPKLLA